MAMSESLEGSSSEVNSPVSFAATETAEGKIAEGDETIENFDLEVQLEDLMICHDDTSDRSTDTWKTGLELHVFQGRSRALGQIFCPQYSERSRAEQSKDL
jgi:hypothetical protein